MYWQTGRVAHILMRASFPYPTYHKVVTISINYMQNIQYTRSHAIVDMDARNPKKCKYKSESKTREQNNNFLKHKQTQDFFPFSSFANSFMNLKKQGLTSTQTKSATKVKTNLTKDTQTTPITISLDEDIDADSQNNIALLSNDLEKCCSSQAREKSKKNPKKKRISRDSESDSSEAVKKSKHIMSCIDSDSDCDVEILTSFNKQKTVKKSSKSANFVDIVDLEVTLDNKNVRDKYKPPSLSDELTSKSNLVVHNTFSNNFSLGQKTFKNKLNEDKEDGEVSSSDSEGTTFFSINNEAPSTLRTVQRVRSSSPCNSSLDSWIDNQLEEPINQRLDKYPKKKNTINHVTKRNWLKNIDFKSADKNSEIMNDSLPIVDDVSSTSIVDDIIKIATNDNLRHETIDITSDNEIEEVNIEPVEYTDLATFQDDTDEHEDSNKIYEFLNNTSDCDSNSSLLSSRSLNESVSLDEEFVPLSPLSLSVLNNSPVVVSDEVYNHRQRLERIRQWELTRFGQRIFSSGPNPNSFDVMFTLMSYNVLSQRLLRDHMYLYKNCKEEYLSWDYRWSLIQHEINQIKPDILTLQEVEATHYYTHYRPWLAQQGFDGVFKKRTGGKVDGCAVFFNKLKFNLLEHVSVEYSQPKAPGVLNRDNVALIVKLVPKSGNGSNLCVATTHLLFNPKRHDVKLAQSVLLFTELDRMCYEGIKNGLPEYCPVIVTGDLNTQPSSPIMDFWKSGFIQFDGKYNKTLTFRGNGKTLGLNLIPASLGISEHCQHNILSNSRALENMRGSIFSLSDKRRLEQDLLQIHNSDWDKSEKSQNYITSPSSTNGSGCFRHNFHLESVYQHFSQRCHQAKEATANQDGWVTVDYVFYSKDVLHNDPRRRKEGQLRLIGKYGLLSGHEAELFSPMPSSVCPSDHYPLAVQFLLKANHDN